MTYRRLPPLNAVRAFEATARHLSVTRAADELSVTPGAVSRQVRELERQLRIDLFRRGAAGMTLTQAGEALFDAARDALDRIAAGVQQAGRSAGARRRLRVGVYSLFASRWLIPRWQRLRERHPELDVDLVTTNDALELVPQRFDAVVAVADDRPRPGLAAVPILPIETVPVCAPSLVKGGSFDLRRQHLLHSRQRPQDWRRWLDAAGIEGVDPDAGSVFESIGVAVDAASEGLGVALAVGALIEGDLASGRVVVPVPFRRRTSRSFVLMYDGARAGDPALTAFRDWLVAEAAGVLGGVAAPGGT
ncbi:MAG: LysR substrate-binding domain-containing protein [Acetobacteraceae bacterium]